MTNAQTARNLTKRRDENIKKLRHYFNESKNRRISKQLD